MARTFPPLSLRVHLGTDAPHVAIRIGLGPLGGRVLSATIAKQSQASRAGGLVGIMLAIVVKLDRGSGRRCCTKRMRVPESNAAGPVLPTIIIWNIVFKFSPPHVPQRFPIIPQWVWKSVVMKVHCFVQPFEDLGPRSGFQALVEHAVKGVAFLISEATGPARWAKGEELVQPPFEGAIRSSREPITKHSTKRCR